MRLPLFPLCLSLPLPATQFGAEGFSCADGNTDGQNGGSGFTADPSALPRRFRQDERAQSREVRIRSYLGVNCACSHRDGGTGGEDWDGRAHLSLLETGVLSGVTVDAPLDPAHRLVVAWIQQEPHPCTTYEEWRTAKLGNTTSPQGQPGGNPEVGGPDDFGERVLGNDPAYEAFNVSLAAGEPRLFVKVEVTP